MESFFADPKVQENLILVGSQLFSFLIFLWILKVFAWKPILKMLETRRNEIKAEFDRIAELENKFKTLNSEYEEKMRQAEIHAKQRLQEELQSGKKLAQEAIDAARKEAQDIIEKGRFAVTEEANKAKEEIRKSVADMVFTISEKFLTSQMDAQKQKDLINKFIKGSESSQ